MYYLGIDIGGSFTKAGLVKSGKVLTKVSVPTCKDKDAFYDWLFGLIDGLVKETKTEVAGIGIGICGMVEGGRLLSAFNLGFENMTIVKTVQDKYKVPCKITNDLACFALAESKHSKIDNVVYLALGTGINAGVVSGGRLFEGANGASIEYGQTSLFDKTVESFVSGKALANGVSQNELLSALEVVLVNICNTYRPQKIFIGGGLSPMISPYIKRLNNTLKDKNYGYKNAPAIPVEISTIANDGGILGASLLF